MLVDLIDLKVKNIELDSDKINCKLWNLRYPFKQKKAQSKYLPILIGGETR